MLSFAFAALLTAAPPADDPSWETYACESGPSIRIALMGGRPATQGFLALEGGTVALDRHKGEADTVLRGGGHMVRPFNWTELLYAPPGREKNAYQCRIEGAAARLPKPVAE